MTETAGSICHVAITGRFIADTEGDILNTGATTDSAL